MAHPENNLILGCLILQRLPLYLSLLEISSSITSRFCPAMAGTAVSLTAEYASPSATKTITHPLPPLPADGEAQEVKDKTAYLTTLRAGTAKLQSDINAFLTQKMQEDTALNGKVRGGQKEDEKAEELYGDEDAEDEG